MDILSNLTLVLGGIKSGKSAHARELAEESGSDVVYMATARRTDEEMEERITNHQSKRPDGWDTIEPEYDLLNATRDQIKRDRDVILLDDFGLLLADWRERDASMNEITNRVQDWLNELGNNSTELIVVSGLANRTLVPTNREAREHLDCVGIAHQMLATAASRVIEVTAGIPRTVKESV